MGHLDQRLAVDRFSLGQHDRHLPVVVHKRRAGSVAVHRDGRVAGQRREKECLLGVPAGRNHRRVLGRRHLQRLGREGRALLLHGQRALAQARRRGAEQGASMDAGAHASLPLTGQDFGEAAHLIENVGPDVQQRQRFGRHLGREVLDLRPDGRVGEVSAGRQQGQRFLVADPLHTQERTRGLGAQTPDGVDVLGPIGELGLRLRKLGHLGAAPEVPRHLVRADLHEGMLPGDVGQVPPLVFAFDDQAGLHIADRRPVASMLAVLIRPLRVVVPDPEVVNLDQPGRHLRRQVRQRRSRDLHRAAVGQRRASLVADGRDAASQDLAEVGPAGDLHVRRRAVDHRHLGHQLGPIRVVDDQPLECRLGHEVRVHEALLIVQAVQVFPLDPEEHRADRPAAQAPVLPRQLRDRRAFDQRDLVGHGKGAAQVALVELLVDVPGRGLGLLLPLGQGASLELESEAHVGGGENVGRELVHVRVALVVLGRRAARGAHVEQGLEVARQGPPVIPAVQALLDQLPGEVDQLVRVLGKFHRAPPAIPCRLCQPPYAG